MRIALVSPCLSRQAFGIKEVVEALSGVLTTLGHTVRVFSVLDADWARADAASWRGADPTLCPFRGPASFRYSPGLLAAVRGFRPDIVHAHGLWMYTSVVTWLMQRSGATTLISPHGMLDEWGLKRSATKKRVARILFEDRNLRGASCIHALTDNERRSVQAFGLRQRIAVIRSGVHTGPTGHEPRPAPWQHSVPENARVMLFLGRLHEVKNLASLLNAWRDHNRPDWHLVVAGPDQGGIEGALRAIATREPASKTIHFAGPLFGADKAAAISAADAFILPSLSEGLPMAVLEAWSAGLPVLMTQACNLPDGFEAGAALRIGENAEDIRAGLEHFLAQSDEARRAMGAAGRKLVVERYSWQAVGREFSQLYEALKQENTAA